jgi:hypothetical protein
LAIEQNNMQLDPVFFDHTGRRWRLARYLLAVVVVGLVSLPAAFLLSAVTVQRAPGVQVTGSAVDDTAIQFGRVATNRRIN